ncbi:AAA family ATPase [Frankia sp. R82]|uniref:helix-turn-helix transcriptional regulator n=1 Tax=Frankia sp. R82 TaxID=2950553 RepID=UPI0035AC2559
MEGAWVVTEKNSRTYPGLVGRDREIRFIESLLSGDVSRCNTLVMRGEPGVGRTALLRHAEWRATTPGGPSARVLWLRGAESESALPCATLADLVLPLRGCLGELPDAQRSALEICLALGEGAPPSPYAACAGTLNLLAAAGEQHPLLVLVDDLQWVDEVSRQVLLFVARRLVRQRVTMLMAIRADAVSMIDGSGLPGIEVGGLSRDACAELFASRGVPIAPWVLEDLVHRLGGNPSALLDTVEALRATQLGGNEPVPELPAPGRRLHRAWAERIDELPESTRAALVMLAIGNGLPAATLERALVVDSGSLADLDAAHRAGLVRHGERLPSDAGLGTAGLGGAGLGGAVSLVHPLLRAVVLERASPAARLRAQAALAEACDGDAGVWFAAATASGPDDEIALALAESARPARARAGYGASAQAWHRAAELTADHALRSARFLRAATDASLAGFAQQACAWADAAGRDGTDPAVRADADLIRGRILMWSGHPTRAYEQLVHAAVAAREHDPGRAAALFAEAVQAALLVGRTDLAVRTAGHGTSPAGSRGASDGVGGEDDLPGHGQGGLIYRARALAVAGEVETARVCLRDAADQLRAADPVADQQLLTVAGHTLLDLEREPAAARLLSTVVEEARRAHAPAILPYALAVRGQLECWRGLWAAGYADGEDALRWAEKLGQVSALGHSLVLLARIDAARGDRELCERRIARLRAESGPYGIDLLDLHADSVLGLAAIGDGDHDAAALALTAAWDRARRHDPGSLMAIPLAADLAEALIRAGDQARATPIVDWLAHRARATGLAWPAAVAARCRGLMADGLTAAEAAFTDADRALDRRRMPFERARTRLCQGEALRRLRRPAAARPPLREARVLFESLGARPWARRATAELLAAGGGGRSPQAGPDHGLDRGSGRGAHRVPDHGPDRRPGPWESGASPVPIDQLTPAELQVARAIGDGMNNAEAAAALFVSRKTVETHLTRVYRKLGLRSRSELVRALVIARVPGPRSDD